MIKYFKSVLCVMAMVLSVLPRPGAAVERRDGWVNTIKFQYSVEVIGMEIPDHYYVKFTVYEPAPIVDLIGVEEEPLRGLSLEAALKLKKELDLHFTGKPYPYVL